MKKTVQPQDKYVLRLPDGMRARIKKAAEKNGRSMNSEIVALLDERFPSQSAIENMIAKQFEEVREMGPEERNSYFRTMALGFRKIASESSDPTDAEKFTAMAAEFEEILLLGFPDEVDRGGL